jgi:hypothetical protein
MRSTNEREQQLVDNTYSEGEGFTHSNLESDLLLGGVPGTLWYMSGIFNV